MLIYIISILNFIYPSYGFALELYDSSFTLPNLTCHRTTYDVIDWSDLFFDVILTIFSSLMVLYMVLSIIYITFDYDM